MSCGRSPERGSFGRNGCAHGTPAGLLQIGPAIRRPSVADHRWDVVPNAPSRSVDIWSAHRVVPPRRRQVRSLQRSSERTRVHRERNCHLKVLQYNTIQDASQTSIHCWAVATPTALGRLCSDRVSRKSRSPQPSVSAHGCRAVINGRVKAASPTSAFECVAE